MFRRSGEIGQVTDIALQPDGKIIAVGSNTSALGVMNIVLLRYESDGHLDPSFDADGKVEMVIPGVGSAASGVALQTDGKIIVAGYTINGADSDFLVARYNVDGSPDLSFTPNGRLVQSISSSMDKAYTVAIQPDGKIVVGGVSNATPTANGHFTLIRLLPGGPATAPAGGAGSIGTGS